MTTGDTGEKSQSFSDEFGQTLCCLARENEKLCAITAAMQSGTGLGGFREEFRSRFFDVGISEEHGRHLCRRPGGRGDAPGVRRVLHLPAACLR